VSLHKAIESGKEKRQPYRGSGAFDYSCHNHRSCGWCRSNRTIQQQRLEQAAQAAKEDHDAEEDAEDEEDSDVSPAPH
jgi:positive regulator of sigma E activity